MIYYFALLLMTIFASFASIFFKKTSNSADILSLIKNKNLYFGGIIYVFAAILNIIALAHIDYSIVMPLGGLTYIWTLFLSKYIFNEKITSKKILGIIFIILGIIIITI